MSLIPEIEAPEDDAEFLNLAPPTQGVTLRLSEPIDLSQDVGGAQGGQAGNLLAVSNVFGWCVAAGNQGFSLFSLPSIRFLAASSSRHTTPDLPAHLQVATPSRVDFLRFAMGDKIVLGGMRDGSVGVWRLKTLVEGNATPSHMFPALSPSPLFDVLPNPAPSSPLVVLLSPQSLTLLNLETQAPVAFFPADLQATAACWSVKGKQVAVGTRGGTIAQFTPEGEKKAEIGLPLALAGESWDVRSLHWLENNVFFVTYAKPAAGPGEPPHEYEVYVITKVGGGIEYSRFMDPTPAFGMMDREGRRWIVRFKGWEPFKHLIFMANAPSSEIGAFGQSTHWASLALPDASRPSLPTATMESTCPLGFEVDLSSTDPTYSGAGDERVAGPPSPHLMVFTNEGVLVIWRVGNESGGKYDGMRKSRDVLTQEDVVEEEPQAVVAAPTPAKLAPSPFAAPASSPFTAPASSPFAVPAASLFGAPAFATPPASPFGAPAFGAPATPAAFGSTGFGAPAFGGGGFGGSAFGASAFGKPASPAPVASAAPAAFTAPAGGAFAAFGAGAATGFGAATPFPSSTSTSAFGSGSAFGAAATPVFGASSTPSAFGSPSTFGASATPSAFGAAATPATGGFGGFGTIAGSTTGLGSFAPKVLSSFGGATSTTSPFGAPKTPSMSAFTSSGTAGFAPSPVSATKPAFAAMSRGNETDSDQEEDMGEEEEEEEQRRVDEPPDLEPTITGLDIGASMATAKSSTDRTGATPATISPPSAFGTGGLNFGGFGLGTPPPATTAAPPTSIFGAAAAATATTTTTKAPAAVGFGFGAGAALPKPTGFSFGSSAAPTPAVGAPAAAPSPFGAPATTPSPFEAPATTPPLFGAGATTPSPFATPATSPFAVPATSPFAVPASSPFGAAASTTSIFGASAPKPPSSPLLLTTPPTPTAATPPQAAVASEQAVPVPTATTSPPTTPSPSSPPLPSAPASTKSLFGFASSPPSTPGAVGSLMGRISSLEEDEGAEEEGEYEEGEYGEEKEGEYGQEADEEEYSEEEGEEEEHYDEHEIDETFDRGDEGEEEAPEAAPALIPSPQPSTPAAAPSLFSRLSPAAASPPPSPSPLVPTSVPSLPFAEPTPATTTALVETTTALVGVVQASAPVLAKPTPPSFGLPAKPAFSGFGQTAVAPAPAPAAKAPTNFFGFTSSAPRSSSPLSMPPAALPVAAPRPTSALAGPPAFSFAPTPTAVAVAISKPAPTFTLPSAPSTFTLPAALTSPISAAPSFVTPPALATPAPFPATAPRAVTPRPIATPQPAPTPKTGPSLAQTTTPKVDSKFGSTAAPSVSETGMAGEFLKAFSVLQNEFEQLRSNTVTCQNFVRDIGQPSQTSSEVVTYDDRSWSLGDLDHLRQLTEKAEPGVKALVGSALVQKRQAAELQSLMLKAETKREEAARFIRARSDPVFAKMVRVRQLGPEQVENQKKIRLAVEAARGRIEQLEEHMITLKDKVVEDRIGRSSFKTPSLDAVNRAVRNITAAITEKTFELDDLALRLDMLRVQPNTPTSLSTSVLRHRTPSVTEAPLGTPLKSKRAPPSPSVAATAQAALKAERSVGILKRALLAVRSTPLLNVSARGSGGATRSEALSDLQLAFAAGPITGDRLPFPRRPHPPPTLKPVVVPQPAPTFAPLAPSFALPSTPSFALPSNTPFDAPTPTAASPSPFTAASWNLPPPQASAFGGLPAFKAPVSITFSAPIAASSSTTSPGSGRGPARQSRQHVNAVQLRTTGETSPASTFDWGVPPTLTPTKVSNFISFAPSAAPEEVQTNGNGEAVEEEEEGFDEDADGEEGSEEWDEGSEEGLDTISEAEEEE